MDKRRSRSSHKYSNPTSNKCVTNKRNVSFLQLNKNIQKILNKFLRLPRKN